MSPTAGAESSSRLEDVGLTLFLLFVAALPVASEIAGIGRWGQGTLGLGTLGICLAGRELGSLLLARWRNGTRARPACSSSP